MRVPHGPGTEIQTPRIMLVAYTEIPRLAAAAMVNPSSMTRRQVNDQVDDNNQDNDAHFFSPPPPLSVELDHLSRDE